MNLAVGTVFFSAVSILVSIQLNGTESVDVVDDDGVGMTVVAVGDGDWTAGLPVELQADKMTADMTQSDTSDVRRPGK